MHIGCSMERFVRLIKSNLLLKTLGIVESLLRRSSTKLAEQQHEISVQTPIL